MEFKLNQKVYIGVGVVLLAAGLAFVIVPLIMLAVDPASIAVNMTTRLAVVGGIMFIPAIIGLEYFMHQGLVFIVGVLLAIFGVWLGLHVWLVQFVPGLGILAIVMLLAGIPSILNSIFMYSWIKSKLELSNDFPVDSQQFIHALMFYAILLAFTLGVCVLLIFLLL